MAIVKRPGYCPIPWRGYPSIAAAVRAHDARWPGDPPAVVAWLLGVAVQDVWNVRAQDAIRGLPQRRAVRLSPAEYSRAWRARQAAKAQRQEGRAS